MGARIGSTGSYVGTQQGVGGGVGVSRSLANHCVSLVVTQLCPCSPQRFSSANSPALRSAFLLTEHFWKSRSNAAFLVVNEPRAGVVGHVPISLDLPRSPGTGCPQLVGA